MMTQRGVALITLLLIVAVVTAISVEIIVRQQLSIRTLGNQLQARQAWHYALGGEVLAQSILRRDARARPPQGRPVADHLGEAWALPQPAYELDEGLGQVRIHIEDLAGRFNLNGLVRGGQADDAAMAQFRRLLLRLDISEPYAERLADWLDADQEPAGEQGAEDNAYLLLDPPYRTAGMALQDLSELRLLLDMQEEHFQRLAPYVSLLPEDTPLNVNTASALVLSSLADELGLPAAEALVEARQPDGFADLDRFLDHPALAGAQVPSGRLALTSRFFQVTSEVQLADRRVALVSMLRRDQDGAVHVLQRNLGQPFGRLPTPQDRGR